MKANILFSFLTALSFCVSPGGEAFAAGEPAAGRKKFEACARCHGAKPDAKIDRQGPVPKLGGQHAGYIVSALNYYVRGERAHPAMKSIAAGLTEQDKEDIAAYFVPFELKKPPIPRTGEPTVIERKIEICKSCHGERGNSFAPDNPRLIGQDESYLRKALEGYKNGTRENPTMVYVMKNLTERDVAEIAAYYAGQKEGLTPME